MAAISQTTYSSAFSWMKMFEFRLKFQWSLFLRVQLTIFQHWFRLWLGDVQATSHYLNQWWLIYRCIYASLGLNKLIGPWGTNLTEIFIKIQQFYFKKMHLKMLSGKWQPSCLGLNKSSQAVFETPPRPHWVNSLAPSGATWCQRTWSTLTLPWVNQCWLIINWVLWHSLEGDFTGNAQDINPYDVLEFHTTEITADPGANQCTFKQEHVGDVQKPSANIRSEWTSKVMPNINYEFPHGVFFMHSTK